MYTSKIKILTIFLLIFSAILINDSYAKTTSNFDWNFNHKNGEIEVSVNIKNNSYIYSKQTEVNVTDSKGKQLNILQSPKKEEIQDKFGERKLVYTSGMKRWGFETNSNPPYEVNVNFQGCAQDPYQCFPPETIQEKIGKNLQREASSKKNINTQEEVKTTFQKSGFLKSWINKSGIWLFLAAMVSGLLSIFTPCVLPLIPITLATLGIKEEEKKGKAIKRSFLYVLGIIITFTTLAILATLSGKAIGFSVFSNKIVLFIFALFFIFMSLSMLGIFNLQLPSSLSVKLNKIGGATDLGAFSMGLVAGFITIPCTGPLLATFLGIAAASSNLFFGGLLLATYAFGFGLPFFIIGIGLLKAPKSGEYMNLIKSLLGVFILLLALYILMLVFPFIYDLFLEGYLGKSLSIIIIIIGVLFGAFHADPYSPKSYVKYLKIIGAVFVAFGIMWNMNLPASAEKGKLTWYSNPSKAILQAEKSQKPILIDFTADWCGACKKMKRVTFSNSKIRKTLNESWIKLRINATSKTDRIERILEKYNVKGFPTLIFMSPDEKILYKNSGYVGPEKLNTILMRILSNNGKKDALE